MISKHELRRGLEEVRKIAEEEYLDSLYNSAFQDGVCRGKFDERFDQVHKEEEKEKKDVILFPFPIKGI